MPERWQNELKKLRNVEPSADVWRRAEEGPQGPGGPNLPPRRQRLVAGIVAFSVFIAAGAFAWRILRPPGARVSAPVESSILATLKVFETAHGGTGPSATLATSDWTIHGTFSSYSWESGTSIGYVDTFDPTFAAADFVEAPAGSLLMLDSDARSVVGSIEERGTYPFKEVRSFGQIEAPVRLDEPPGRYILHFVATWNQGTVNVYFPIELVAPKPTLDVGATLSFVGKEPPEANLDWDGAQQDAVQGGYTWCDGSGQCVSAIPEFATYPPVDQFLLIPKGTTLRLDGEIAQLDGSFLSLDGEKVSDVALDDLGTVPTAPGRYALELNVELNGSDGEHGSAIFFFGIEVVAGPLGHSDLLPCERSRRGTSIGGSAADYVSNEATIRSLLTGLLPQDVFEVVLRPSPVDVYRIIREGSVIAWALVVSGGDGMTRVEFEACVGSGLGPTNIRSSRLEGSSWLLAAIDGVPVPAGAEPVTLEFSGSRLGGNDGCNSYGASYRVDGASIRVTELASTAMLCSGGGTMDRAHALSEGLLHVTSFGLTDDRLMIASASSSLEFERATTP